MKNKIIKNEIMEKINKKEVRMKPRWWFAAWEETKVSATIAMVLTAGLTVGGLIYWWEIKQPQSVSELKDISWQIGFEGFPVLLVLGTVVLSGMVAILLGKIGDNYKKPVQVIALITTILLVVTGIIAWGLIHRYEFEILLNLS